MPLRREAAANRPSCIPLGLLIGFVFLSLLLGWATATECAAWGVLGSLAHRLVARRADAGRSFWDSVMGTTRVTCMIMLILAGASFMSTSMAYTGIPVALANWVDGLQPVAPMR